jgi:hypothetical protein
MALAKACMMLAKLENDGTRVLTLSIPEPEIRPLPTYETVAPWRFQPQYAVFAATIAMAVITVTSVETASRKITPTAIPVVSVPASDTVRELSSSRDVLLTSTEQSVTPPRRRVRAPKQEQIVPVRHFRPKPFLPPDGDVEAPEFNLAHVPPAVYAARRLDTPAGLMRLPEAPPKRVRRSRRMFSVLVSPFKKVGGALATLVVGRDGPGI